MAENPEWLNARDLLKEYSMLDNLVSSGLEHLAPKDKGQIIIRWNELEVYIITAIGMARGEIR